MYRRESDKDPPVESWSIRLPIIPTYAWEEPRSDAQPQHWIVDTGCSGAAYAWRHHLERAGIEFERVKRFTGEIRQADAGKIPVWLCSVRLWLVTGDPQHRFFLLPRYKLSCNQKTVNEPDDEVHRAVIGMRILLALFKMEISFTEHRFSIWTFGVETSGTNP
jgi:hypothetical protein